jgi:hypothetical protein
MGASCVLPSVASLMGVENTVTYWDQGNTLWCLGYLLYLDYWWTRSLFLFHL